MSVFDKELELISSKDVKTLVIKVFERVSEHFFDAPASSSGKYHLEDECKNGGLVLHTRRVVRMAHTIYGLPWYSQELPAICHDYLIAAALLHDVCKSGRNWEGDYTVTEHPLLAADLVLEVAGTEFSTVAQPIAATIRSHMGTGWYDVNWEKPELPTPVTVLQKLLHEADYLASRKYIEVTPM